MATHEELVKDNCLTMHENKKGFPGKPFSLEGSLESLGWLIKGFVGEYECTPVDSHRFSGADIQMNLQGLLWRNMVIPYEPSRLIGTYRNCREIKGT